MCGGTVTSRRQLCVCEPCELLLSHISVLLFSVVAVKPVFCLCLSAVLPACLLQVPPQSCSKFQLHRLFISCMCLM